MGTAGQLGTGAGEELEQSPQDAVGSLLGQDFKKYVQLDDGEVVPWRR